MPSAAPLPVLTEDEFDPVARIHEFSRRIEELRALRAIAKFHRGKSERIDTAIGRYRATIRRLSWLPQRRGLFR